MVDGEVWRIVPSASKLMASSEGRIMVVPYQYEMPHGGVRQYGGSPRFGVWSKHEGRFITVLKGKTYKVARCVCEAFHGPRPFDDAVAMHLDENAANNRASNILWGTQKENLNAPGFIAYCKSRTGDQSPTRKSRAKQSRPEMGSSGSKP